MSWPPAGRSACCRQRRWRGDRGRGLPIHADPDPQVAPAIAVEEAAFAPAVEIEVAEDLHVFPAVFLHQIEPALAHPFEALKPVGRLVRAQRLLGEMAHADP